MIILTKQGKTKTKSYVNELNAKRKEIVDAGLDAASKTSIPSIRDIIDDISFTGVDEEGEYYNGWGVTDNYDADFPLSLKAGEDFEEVEIDIDMWYNDLVSEVDKIDVSFSDADCVYRGNLYIAGKMVGDYSCNSSTEIERAFPQLSFDWDKSVDEPEL